MHPGILIAQAAETSAESGLDFSFQNVIDGNGIQISIYGMAIVFTSLVLISISIALLPRVLRALSGILPPESHGHGHSHHGSHSHPVGGEAATIAAIGMALHRRRREG